MNNYLPLLFIAILLNQCQLPEDSKKEPIPGNQLVIGFVDTLYSEILGERRELWIHVPEDADLHTEMKHPVLYLLDGDSHFYSVVGMIQQLSSINSNMVSPRMIVVAIPNTDRTRDLTPTNSNYLPFDFGIDLSNSGGGEKFMDFIEHELVPYVDKNYPATNYRTLVGHSFGGLTVINTLLKRPHLFANYISIDPSLWWDRQVLLKAADTALSAENFENKSLFLGIANTMPEDLAFAAVQDDTSAGTVHIQSILKFVNSAEKKPNNGLQFGWKYYENDTHSSVPLITEYDALRFIFPWYGFNMTKFFDPDYRVTEAEFVENLQDHYKVVSKKFGYQVLPDESVVNELGYFFMGKKDMNLAYAAFNTNIQNHPTSTNVYDSMGDWYLAEKDSLKALEYFNKALQVGDNDYSQEKIDMLEKYQVK